MRLSNPNEMNLLELGQVLAEYAPAHRGIETHQADVQDPYILSDCLMQYQPELQEE